MGSPLSYNTAGDIVRPWDGSGRPGDGSLKVQGPAYCVLRTENIFVCCCCVGSDRVAGVREVQALGLLFYGCSLRLFLRLFFGN